MPSISQFYGIIIHMYFQQREHNPPHVHAVYGGDSAEFSIKTGELLDGDLPPKAIGLVCEWLDMHRDELLEMWKSQEFKELKPLE